MLQIMFLLIQLTIINYHNIRSKIQYFFRFSALQISQRLLHPAASEPIYPFRFNHYVLVGAGHILLIQKFQFLAQSGKPVKFLLIFFTGYDFCKRFHIISRFKQLLVVFFLFFKLLRPLYFNKFTIVLYFLFLGTPGNHLRNIDSLVFFEV